MNTSRFSTILLILLFAACSSGEVTLKGSAHITADTSAADSTGTIDISGSDRAGQEEDTLSFDDVDLFPTDITKDTSSCNEIPFGFGCGCSDNGDCMSGFCVPSSQGFVCTEECLEDCPEGWECKGSTGFGVDLIFICLPQSDSTCIPCEADEQCGSDFMCVSFGDGSFCTRKCNNAKQCPGDFSCESLGVEAGLAAYCQPPSGSCLCLSKHFGQQRPCVATNGFGQCNGYETCDPAAGWVGCSAPAPTAELCDGKDNDCDGSFDESLDHDDICKKTVPGVGSCAGVSVCQGPAGWACTAPIPEVETCDFKDNDCDGQTDEDFKTAGKYVHPNHCGTCFNDCTGTIPNGKARCDGSGLVAVCVVDECDDGFYPLGPYQCLPEGEALCTPCSSDLACEGGKCVSVGGSLHCTESCVDVGCPEFYECSGIDGLPGKWCLPVSNDCDCSKANAGAHRPCSITGAFGTCFGTETCDPEAGWSGCTAVPPEPEICDGLDNDCSGIPDDGLPASKPCANTQEGVGTCSGLEICLGAQGWVCTAPKPEPEACDYKDNDCDGIVDEDLIVDGKYSTLKHCGECNKSCVGALPNATALCDAGEATPKCKVKECDEGFFQLNAYQCILPPDVQCAPCDSDSDCYFASCVFMAEGAYCLEQCEEGLCADGYTCKSVAGKGPYCVPASNTCECSADNFGATKGCSLTNGLGTCFGIETCEGDGGWSPCSAAVPAVEVCDGLDNDCNGLIDDGLVAAMPCTKHNEFGTCKGVSLCQGQSGWVCQAKVPTAEVCDFVDNDCDDKVDEDFKLGSKYVTPAHCGTCNNACLDAIPNGTGTCDPEYLLPKCVVDECDAGYFQLSAFECILPPNTTCQPCGSDEDCVGSSCLEFDGQLRCASACEEDLDCGAGFQCLPYAGFDSVCQPLSGSCECTEGQFGKKRSCSKANDIGECFGFETCLGDDGWSPCDALLPAGETCDGIDNNCNGLVDEALPLTQPCSKNNQWGQCAGLSICQGALGWVCQAQTPAPEACDYVDNDCDELVDEDFVVDGKYGVLNHCGSCNKDCEGALPNADSTVCDTAGPNALCKISECAEGYFPLNQFQCIEPPDVQCNDCNSDDDCFFDKCVPLDQGSFCLQDCSAMECGADFTCEDVAGFGAVCVPLSGSCECSEATAGAKRGCSMVSEFGTCFGFETCVADSGWSECSALLPAMESCDGIDNDCNGLIDDSLPPTQPCSKDNEFGSCDGLALCQGIKGWVCQAAVPASEACDYQDNDCDGSTDEDFVEGGKYVADDHCGTCNNFCFDAIPDASGVCDGGYPVPKCVVAQCDDGFFQLSPFQCVVPPDTTCQACTGDQDCLGSKCVSIDGKNRCARQCVNDAGCGGENACLPYAGLDSLCQPESGSCECSSFNQGSKRSCSNVNEVGICFGFQTCDAVGGWSACDALVPAAEVCDGIDNNCNGLIDDGLALTMPCQFSNEFGVCVGQATCVGSAGWVCQAAVPAVETCDYVDNDCDGEIDETFRNEEGDYDAFAHCGSCTISCDGGFPHAIATCDAAKDTPQCVVEGCDDGYFKLNEFQCIPNTASLCESCSTDDNCVLDGAKCVTLSDGKYCSKHCDDDGDCPAGYSCETYAGDTQCLPLTNSCACDGSNTELARSCSATWPVDPAPGAPYTTCYGSQGCEITGWSDCVLPDEVCDGLDNDCNGIIDDGFLVGGKYTGDTNCGQCGNNCTFLAYPNASGICDVSKTVPDCKMACGDGYFDVNGNPADGCECQFAGETDYPDGIDQNCDGVDGEVDNGIFVAKNGSDQNSGTMSSPLLTVQAAINKANQSGYRDVYVATGVYNGSLLLKQGIQVYGGYASTFLTRDILLYETVVIGGSYSEQRPGAVNAIAIGGAAGTTVFDGFTVFGRNNNSKGGSSYGVYVRDSGHGLAVTNNHVVAGNGGNGELGSAGSDGTDGTAGSPGDAAFAYGNNNCGAEKVTDGGSGGANFCGGVDVSGGDGGDSHCPQFSAPDGGEFGVDGDGTIGGDGGDAGWDGRFTSSCGLCTVPTSNNPSEGQDGDPGSDGQSGVAGQGCTQDSGEVVNGLWKSVSGAAGGAGSNGAGGGGGGSGGGADVIYSYLNCNDQIGGTGGGGGSAGCSGTGATAGGGAGGSFGIFIFFSSTPATLPALAQNFVEAGIGGAGGAGGAGGTGGVGGSGAQGGAPGVGAAWCAYGGGTGGDGGNGGHGGGGGGGCGGVSYCVYVAGQGGVSLMGYKAPTNTCAEGSGGPGGSGGPSIGDAGIGAQSGSGGATNF